MTREITIFDDDFSSFYNSLNEKAQRKIDYSLDMVRTLDLVPEKFLKHIEGTKGLFEVKAQSGNDIFRIFCCFDKGRVVILFNGFQKKSQKAPKKEITKALRLMKDYYDST